MPYSTHAPNTHPTPPRSRTCTCPLEGSPHLNQSGRHIHSRVEEQKAKGRPRLSLPQRSQIFFCYFPVIVDFEVGGRVWMYNILLPKSIFSPLQTTTLFKTFVGFVDLTKLSRNQLHLSVRLSDVFICWPHTCIFYLLQTVTCRKNIFFRWRKMFFFL